MRDQQCTRVTALPAAAASNAPTGVDLHVYPTTGPLDGQAHFHVTRPATPSLADATTITTVIEDSADNVTFTAIPGVATIVTTGAGGAGAAAIDVLRHIPKETRRYVRAKDTVLTGGGSNVAVSTTFSVDFHAVL